MDRRMPRRLASGALALALLFGVATAAQGASGPDEQRSRKLAATGIPGLCAERFDGDPARERCVQHQLEAGRRIRAILLANRDDAELAGTVERCAADSSSRGAYDWVEIRSCTDRWLRRALQERPR